MTRLPDIRGALQLQAARAIGFPPEDQRSYQGKTFTSTAGVPWVRMTVMNQLGRPFDLAGDSRIDGGIFLVDLFFPDGLGTNDIETLAEAVTAAFKPGVNLFQGATRVWTLYSQAGSVREQPDWLMLPITIGWRCKSTA